MSPHKSQRNRFSQKHRSDGKRLAELLRQQREAFPSFAEQLDDLIRKVMDSAQRTRAGDREKVLRVLREWGGLNQNEIVEDTGLSRWDVRQILYGLIKDGVVIETRPRLIGDRPQWRRTVYRIKGQLTR